MTASNTGPRGHSSSLQNQGASVNKRDVGLAFLFGTAGGGVLGILALGVIWLFSSGAQPPPTVAETGQINPTGQTGPTSQKGPTGPTGPTSPTSPTGPTSSPDPTGPARPPDPTDSPDPANPLEVAEKLRLIALAMHIHHDQFRSFPVQPKKEWLDEQGRPKVSWRVHLLQFLDQRPLYDLFHLDEPWDSPHNRPLAEKMPDVYRSSPKDGNLTRMHVLSGETMLFRPGPVSKLADCYDGASQTFMIVHAGVDRAELWTKPDNLAFNPDKPLAAVGDLRSRGLQAAMVNGKVWTFPPDLTAEEFTGLATPHGGEVIDASSVVKRLALGIPAPQPSTASDAAAAKVPAALSQVQKLQAASDRLKRIGLGVLDFHDVFRRYPPPENKSYHAPQGGPFLSWRVHLLQFLDQEPLYRQFKLNEPWDSAHNRALLGKMPDLYREADDPPDTTTTRVLTFSGADTLFPGGVGLSLRDVRDGTSCTILLVRAGKDQAVPWTKPVDVVFDAAAPLGGCGAPAGEPLLVVLADISVQQLAPAVPNDLFRALVTPAGGETLDRARLQEFGFR